MIVSILSLICWVWLPARPVSLHHSEWRQQSRLYEWTESPPEAGRWHRSQSDVTLETRRREGALWDLPFTLLPLPFYLSLPFSPRQFPCPVKGSYYRLVTHPLTPHPREMLPCYLPQPYPALPSPACSSPLDFGPSRKNPNFTPTLCSTGGKGC